VDEKKEEIEYNFKKDNAELFKGREDIIREIDKLKEKK